MKFALFLGLVVSASAWSQTSYEVDQQIRQVQSKLSRLQNRLNSMPQNRLRKLSTKLDKIQGLLRGGNSGGPIGRRVTISGNIESSSFVYEVSDSFDLARNCINEFKGKLRSVNEMRLSVNFRPQVSLKKSLGWWAGAGDYCSKLSEAAFNEGLRAPRFGSFAVAGSIGSTAFIFEGYSLRDVLLQCNDFYTRSKLRLVDEVTIFNGERRVVKEKSPGWWSSSSEVCNMIVQELR